MKPTDTKEKRKHHGHALKKIRETLGIRQRVFASDLGMSPKTITSYEQMPLIEDEILEKFAQALNVSVDLIKELEEDAVTIIIENNTFQEGSIANVAGNNTNNFSPIEQILELNKEKQALYERMLALEKEKSALLEQLLKERK